MASSSCRYSSQMAQTSLLRAHTAASGVVATGGTVESSLLHGVSGVEWSQLAVL
jgi:hypothetical protein